MKHHSGSIEVVCGSMFSGKTEELIRRLRREHPVRAAEGEAEGLARLGKRGSRFPSIEGEDRPIRFTDERQAATSNSGIMPVDDRQH